MIQVSDDVILIGTAELRKNVPQLTKNLSHKTVIVTKRGKPIGVLEDFSEHEEKKKLLDTFEDLVLGYLAKERDQKSKKGDYITEEEMSKKLGITL